MVETILVTSSRALILACEEMGVDTDSMLQAVGVARGTIEDPDARLPAEQARALWAKAYELSGDPDLSLHAAERLPFGAYKVIDYMAQQAPTVGGGIGRISDYFPLINSAVRLPIEVGTHRVTFDVVCPDTPEMLTRPYSEYIFAAVILRTRIASGIDYPLEDSVFPPGFVPPALLWHETAPNADAWMVRIDLTSGGGSPLTILVPGAPPPTS